MAEKKPSNDGISPEELEAQEIAGLPNREAMSLITPSPVEWTPDYLANDTVQVYEDDTTKGPIAPAPPPVV